MTASGGFNQHHIRLVVIKQVVNCEIHLLRPAGLLMLSAVILTKLLSFASTISVLAISTPSTSSSLMSLTMTETESCFRVPV